MVHAGAKREVGQTSSTYVWGPQCRIMTYNLLLNSVLKRKGLHETAYIVPFGHEMTWEGPRQLFRLGFKGRDQVFEAETMQIRTLNSTRGPSRGRVATRTGRGA